jgi:anti-sigma factor RsiW
MGMRCQEVERLLPDYSVGLLKPRDERVIASHLESCPGCHREWQALEDTVALVEQFGAVEPPPGLWNGVYNRLTGQAPEPVAPSPWARLWRRPARVFGTAVLAVALAAGLWFSNLPHPPGVTDHEMNAAIREHALASADALFADRAGLESVAILASGSGGSRTAPTSRTLLPTNPP